MDTLNKHFWLLPKGKSTCILGFNQLADGMKKNAETLVSLSVPQN